MLQENTMLCSGKWLKENLRKNLGCRCCAGWKRLQGIGALSARSPRLLPSTRRSQHQNPSSTRPFISKPNLLWATPLFRAACNWCTVKAHLRMFHWFLFSMLSWWKDEEGELQVFRCLFLSKEDSFYIIVIDVESVSTNQYCWTCTSLHWFLSGDK